MAILRPIREKFPPSRPVYPAAQTISAAYQGMSVGIPLSFSRTGRRHGLDPATPHRTSRSTPHQAMPIRYLRFRRPMQRIAHPARAESHRIGQALQRPSGDADPLFALQAHHATGRPHGSGMVMRHWTDRSASLAPSRSRHPHTCHNRYGFRDRCRRQPARPASRQSGRSGLHSLPRDQGVAHAIRATLPLAG